MAEGMIRALWGANKPTDGCLRECERIKVCYRVQTGLWYTKKVSKEAR